MAWKARTAVVAVIMGALPFSGAAIADSHDGAARNWGGFWFGFGGGYSESSYGGGFDSDLCITSSAGTGSAALCEVVGDQVVAIARVARPPGPTYGGVARAVTQGLGDITNGLAELVLFEPFGSSTNTNGYVGLTGDTTEGWLVSSSGPSGSINAAVISFNRPSTTVFGSVAAIRTTNVGSDSGQAIAIGLSGLPTDFSASSGGMAPNINLHFDHQTQSNWVFGAALDLTFPQDGGNTSSRPDIPSSPGIAVERAVAVDTKMLASAQLRLGYAAGNFLFYGTAGPAFGSFDATLTETGSFNGLSGSQSQSTSATAFGGVFGGGISAFVSDNAAISIEGQYYTFGKSISFANTDTSVTLDDAFSVMTKFTIKAN